MKNADFSKISNCAHPPRASYDYSKRYGSAEEFEDSETERQNKRFKVNERGAYTNVSVVKSLSSDGRTYIQYDRTINHLWGSGEQFTDRCNTYSPEPPVQTCVVPQRFNYAHLGHNVTIARTETFLRQPHEQFVPQPSWYVPIANATTDIVCYGMISQLQQISLARTIPDELLYPFQDQSALQQLAHLNDRAIQILNTLRNDASTVFEFKLEQTNAYSTVSKARNKAAHMGSQPYSLSAVLYGPKDLADDVGDWLDEIEIYLQVPTYSNINVLYHNPHAISGGLALTTTFDLIGLSQKANPSRAAQDAKSYLDTYTTRTFDEAEQPYLVRSALHAHQKQAVTFMQNRECGWDLEDVRRTDDMWRSQPDGFGREKYVNVFSGESFFKPPHEFRGGLLADDMGLGKTCSMLALIASEYTSATDCGSYASINSMPGPTLIVVPLPLLQVWEKQINQHYRPSSITVFTYYGQNRRSNTSLFGFNIVLTTYNVVAKEWKSWKRTQSGLPNQLFGQTWHRIVLDEAHIIKNKDTDLAKSVTALDGDCRWCVTGTPIQNRSSEIYSLLRFMRVFPFDDVKKYEAVFVRPSGMDAEILALQNLQRLMRTLAIRRPKTVIDLAPSTDFTIPVVLSEDERRVYYEAKRRVIRVIEEAFYEVNSKVGTSYINALQRINDLRYICNHGVMPTHKPKIVKNIDFQINSGSIQHELDLLVAMNNEGICQNCGNDLSEDLLDKKSEEFLNVINNQQKGYRNRLCSNCSISTSSPAPSISSTPDPNDISTHSFPSPGVRHISSKIQALISAVQRTPSADKCAIFSYWTSTLDAIGHAFDDAQISYIRYDGSMTRTKRDAVLNAFIAGSDKTILVSISCGGQGLDLTAANHAFLVEPQWNPMLEEQAMSRVHRLGQKKAVQLVRFVVKDTWEEKIVALQERKRMLAELIVDGSSGHMEKLKGEEGKKKLILLRDLVA